MSSPGSWRQMLRPRTRALIRAALTTGARRDELASLRWADIDRESRRAVLRSRKAGERSVPLPPELVEQLDDLRAAQDTEGTLVFGGRQGEPCSPEALAETVRGHTPRVCGRAISLPELRLWVLRMRKR